MATVEESQAENIAFQIPDKLLFSENMFDSIVEALIKFESASTVYFHVQFNRDSLDSQLPCPKNSRLREGYHITNPK